MCHWKMTTCYDCSKFQVDAMLQKLEKEIDDVDAKIGDRWRVLDRFVRCCLKNYTLICDSLYNVIYIQPVIRTYKPISTK